MQERISTAIRVKQSRCEALLQNYYAQTTGSVMRGKAVTGAANGLYKAVMCAGLK